jgi:hypothetical protein
MQVERCFSVWPQRALLLGWRFFFSNMKKTTQHRVGDSLSLEIRDARYALCVLHCTS